MQQILTETEKLEIIEHEWAKARAKNPEVIMRVRIDRQDRVLVVGLPQAQPATAWQVGE